MSKITKMNQLLPFMETDHYMICEFITDDLQENDDLVELTPSVKPNKKTNYFIRFKKPSISWRYFLSPLKKSGSVKTEIAAAPATSYSLAISKYGKCSAMMPFDGDAFFTSQMKLKSC